jgi:hypothetical protein
MLKEQHQNYQDWNLLFLNLKFFSFFFLFAFFSFSLSACFVHCWLVHHLSLLVSLVLYFFSFSLFLLSLTFLVSLLLLLQVS